MHQNRFFYKYFKLFLSVAGIIAIGWHYTTQTDGFTIQKISSDLTYHPQWETPPLSYGQLEEVREILDQPFFYLSKGAQCYAFISKDQNYVIKFFRFHHLRAPLWMRICPLPLLGDYQQKKIATRQNKLFKDFGSYKIAYEELKEEAGLVLLHLNKTENLQKHLLIYDKIGVPHRLNLDRMEFVLQRRADLVYPFIETLIVKQEMDLAKKSIHELAHLLLKRCQKGIYDKDPDLKTNFGFTRQKPIQIDIGRFKKDESRKNPAVYCEELVRITDPFKKWLHERSPELEQALEECLVSIREQSLDKDSAR